MTTLSEYALVVGGAHCVVGLGLAAIPALMREWIRLFPRDVWAGRILAAVAMAWSILLVREMPLGWFDAYKMWLWVATPVGYMLIVLFMEELLAARAFGGVLLLAACPVLEEARFHESQWRLALVVLAYVWVVAGMALVLGPYRFRKWAAALCGNDIRCRIMAAVYLVSGGLFVWLGLTIFSA